MQSQDLVCYGPTDVIDSEIIFAFDLDHTLIKPKNGRIHALDAFDWEWWNPVVPEVLRRLKGQIPQPGLVIFSNQGGISKGVVKFNDLITKLEAVFRDLGFKILTHISTSYTKYRKPAPGAWESFIENFAPSVRLAQSAFVGDAAGREFDFSTDDRSFALNCGLNFKTPEEFFLSQKVVIPAPTPQLTDLVAVDHYDRALIAPPLTINELVIFVGPPASGKSFLAKRYFNGWSIINQDSVRTRAKCLSALKLSLSRHENAVIDNTSPSPESRKDYIALARAAQVRVRIIYMKLPLALCRHLNFLRTANGGRYVPSVAFATWQKKFVHPQQAEYDELCVIDKLPFDPMAMPPEIFKLRS